MSQRGGGKRTNKLRRGPPKADDYHNRPAKNKQRSSDACHDDPPREGPEELIGESKIEDKSQKEVSIVKTTDKQDVQEDVSKKQPENVILYSNCSNSECVNIKMQYEKLLAEKDHHYMEIIKQLKEEIQHLTSKDHENNVPEEIMEVDIFTKHAANLDDACVKSSELAEESCKLWKKEAKQDSAHAAGSQQDAGWNIGTQVNRGGSQQTASWSEEIENETERNTPLGQQEIKQEVAAKISNITDNFQEQNRSEKKRITYSDVSQQGGSNRSGSRDCRPYSKWQERGSRNYEYKQPYGQRQGRDRESWRNNQGEQSVKHKVLNEIEGDLFTAPKTCSLAHCVAEDMRMGSGIAVTFRQMFKQVDELLEQGAQTGGLAVLKDEGRFIYYLVTKRLSNGKPHLEDLKSSLITMRQHMLENNVHDVAMPKIGCGLDRLNWYEVKNLLIEIFGKDDINITVYNFNRDQGESNQPKSSLRITHAGYSLANIAYGTGLLYLGSEDEAVSESLANLLPKFPILQQYKQSPRHVGQCVRTESKGEVLYGLIIKKNSSDEFSFTAFSQCVEFLKNIIRKDRYQYAGIDVICISDDPELDTEKLVTVFRNVWFQNYIDLYICWPEKYISVYKECHEESRFRKQ